MNDEIDVEVDEQIRIEKAIYAHAADDGEFAVAYALVQVAKAAADIAAALGELRITQ
jgi:hypothetical protein